MSLVLERFLVPLTGHKTPPASIAPATNLNVTVLFTSVESTLAALKRAGNLAENLNASIVLVVLQIVPYPLPITSPPVLVDFSERRFRVIASKSPVPTTVRLYLCRDREEAFKTVLAPHSLVVIGGRKTWWPCPEMRLARKLRRAGHEVVFAEE